MNNSKLISVSKDTIHYLTAFFPLAFSMAVYFDFGITVAIALACLVILFAPSPESEKIMPVYASFMILGLYTDHTLGASVICGILLVISSFFCNKLKSLFISPAVSGVMLSAALTVTVLFTTDYFGIGATGTTVTDMIKSYVSLGFHPNWRGVLYGTIVMVIMITFPRKFKELTKTVSAPFIAIAITLILNILLNPPDMVSAITEIEDKEASLIEMNSTFSLETVICGIALFIICFYAISCNDNTSKKDYVIGGIANGISVSIFGLPLPYGISKNKQSFLPRAIAAGFLILLFYFGKEIILRIPVHSCAVVIIVGAWNSVKWGEIKKTFSSLSAVACFTACLLLCLVTDLAYGIFISFLISALYCVFSKNSKIFIKS